MEEKLRISLSTQIRGEIEHHQNTLKSRITTEVNKVINDVFSEFGVHFEISLKDIISRSLDSIMTEKSEENADNDKDNHKKEQINEDTANHDDGDLNHVADVVGKEKEGKAQTNEPRQSETQIESLPPSDSEQTDNVDNEEPGTSGSNGHNITYLSNDDLDEDTADSDALARGDFEDEFDNDVDMIPLDDPEEGDFDEEDIDDDDDDEDNDHQAGLNYLEEDDDPLDGMYEIPDNTNSGNGQRRQQTDNFDATSQDSINKNGYVCRKRKIPKSMQLDSEAELVNEGIHIKFGIRCTVEGCEVICNFKAELDQHLLTFHGMNPYLCVLTGCNRSFSDISQLVIHQNVTHKDVTNWECRDCQKENDSSQRLQQHHYTAHYVRVYRCTMAECSFSANSRRDALRHFQVYHTQVYREMKSARSGKQFMCPYKGCGKYFTERTNLRTHKRFHTRSKPFGCSWPSCKYLSEDRANTIRHIRVRHLRLPATLKEQQERGISNNEDPRQWLQIHNDQF